MAQLSDAEERLLVARTQLGDQEALGQLVRQYSPRLTWYVRRFGMGPDTSDDVVQEVWLVVLTKMGKLRDTAKFRPWLYGIARNKTRQYLALADQHEVLPSNLQDSEESPDEESFLQYHLRNLPVALERLSVPHREVLALRFLEGMSYSELAEATETTEGTVKSRLHYAKIELRRHLEGMPHE